MLNDVFPIRIKNSIMSVFVIQNDKTRCLETRAEEADLIIPLISNISNIHQV
jgi:hypothetical protein